MPERKREKDWTTGLIYFRARWYDPVTARFISKDPIGIAGGHNQYAAFGNNPINRTDSLGLYDADMTPGDATDGYGGKLGYYDVDVHGDSSGHFSDGNNPLSPEQVYQQMKSDCYKDGTPINLVACNAGLTGGDAQKLANLAKAKVNASTGVVTISMSPQFVWGDKVLKYKYTQTTDGKWVTVKPKSCGER